VGAYAGKIDEVRWGYYKGWSHGQVRRALVRKRWFQVVIHSEPRTLLLRIQDNGTLGTGHLMLLDRSTGQVLHKSQQAAPLRQLVVGPDAGEGTQAFLREGSADVTLNRQAGQSAWILALHWKELDAELRLESGTAPTPSLVIGEARAPLAHRPALMQRAPLLAVSGNLWIHGRPTPFDGAMAEVAYYNAFLPKHTGGLWLSAEGSVGDKRVAIACSEGDLLGTRQEATLFVDGQPHALPGVELAADGSLRGQGVALRFRTQATHETEEQRMRGLIHHHSRYAVGALEGSLTLPTGAEASFSGRALLEQHRLSR
jgi:hypothetical protein